MPKICDLTKAVTMQSRLAAKFNRKLLLAQRLGYGGASSSTGRTADPAHRRPATWKLDAESYIHPKSDPVEQQRQSNYSSTGDVGCAWLDGSPWLEDDPQREDQERDNKEYFEYPQGVAAV